MMIEVGEDFEEEFNWELENCMVQVRCKPKEKDRSSNAHSHWSEPVGSFEWLRVP